MIVSTPHAVLIISRDSVPCSWCLLCCAVVFFGVQVFEQLLRRRVTFNGYTYHCLLQLCGSAGSLDDALAVYNLQVRPATQAVLAMRAIHGAH